MKLPFNLATADAVCAQLGQRCRCMRLQNNLSQAALASMADSSLSSIRRLESQGQCSLELFVRVAQTLHASAQLESLLNQPVQTIAQSQQQAALQTRQRARKPRGPKELV